jgi:hypothetical protein
MRALIVLCALVATPLLVGVSQGLPGKSSCLNGKGTANRSIQGTASAHKGLCVPQGPQDPPPPPPPAPGGGCVNSAPAGGTAAIDGQVFSDAFPWPGLTDWCVELSGPVNATAVTDASGNYVFTGLPAGTYTVCEVVQAGWHQTFPTSGPSCGNGLGWSITVMDGGGAGFVWFGNLTP